MAAAGYSDISAGITSIKEGSTEYVKAFETYEFQINIDALRAKLEKEFEPYILGGQLITQFSTTVTSIDHDEESLGFIIHSTDETEGQIIQSKAEVVINCTGQNIKQIEKNIFVTKKISVETSSQLEAIVPVTISNSLQQINARIFSVASVDNNQIHMRREYDIEQTELGYIRFANTKGTCPEKSANDTTNIIKQHWELKRQMQTSFSANAYATQNEANHAIRVIRLIAHNLIALYNVSLETSFLPKVPELWEMLNTNPTNNPLLIVQNGLNSTTCSDQPIHAAVPSSHDLKDDPLTLSQSRKGLSKKYCCNIL